MTTNEMMERHVAATRTYLITYGLLIFLTFTTVGASFLPLAEPWHTFTALFIAAVKATLILAIFMHAYYANGVLRLFVGGGFFWLSILILLTIIDYMTRRAAGF